MSRALASLVLSLLAVGCNTNRGEIREVRRPAPPAPPRQLRFELVETAALETGSKGELWFPLASSEPGVQDIERLDVTIKPDTPYEVRSDSHGNRVLHLESALPVAVQVAYRVLRTEVRADRDRVEERPLSEDERRVLAAELGPTEDPELTALRKTGKPARRASGVRLTGAEVRHDASWIEVYTPGLAWAPLKTPRAFDKGFAVEWSVRVDVLIVAHGNDAPLPSAKVDSLDVGPLLTFKVRTLEAP